MSSDFIAHRGSETRCQPQRTLTPHTQHPIPILRCRVACDLAPHLHRACAPHPASPLLDDPRDNRSAARRRPSVWQLPIPGTSPPADLPLCLPGWCQPLYSSSACSDPPCPPPLFLRLSAPPSFTLLLRLQHLQLSASSRQPFCVHAAGGAWLSSCPSRATAAHTPSSAWLLELSPWSSRRHAGRSWTACKPDADADGTHMLWAARLGLLDPLLVLAAC